MLYGEEVAVYSEINTKHINTERGICHFLSLKKKKYVITLPVPVTVTN